MRKRGLSPAKSMLRRSTSTGGRQAWDKPKHNERDPATVALSERYERESFISSYCKARDLDGTRWKAQLNELLDEYAETQRSRRPEVIAEWLDAKRATQAAEALGYRLLRQGWGQRRRAWRLS